MQSIIRPRLRYKPANSLSYIWLRPTGSIPGFRQNVLGFTVKAKQHETIPRNVDTSCAELFPGDLPDPLNAYIPRFAVELLNLTALPDAEIPQAPAPLSAALWAMKYARTQTEKTLAALDRLAATVGKALVEQQGFDTLKLYIVQAPPYEPGATDRDAEGGSGG